jgi:hypothetical protein
LRLTEESFESFETVINPRNINGRQRPRRLAAAVNDDEVHWPSGALLFVKLAGDREMIHNIVVLVEEIIEAPLGRGVVTL